VSPTSAIQTGPRTLARQSRGLSERLGQQIAALREEAGVTQSQLARCAGMTQSYLSEIEAGTARPAVTILLAIGNCLGADLGVRYFPGVGPRIHYRFQAPMVEALFRVLGRDWQAQPEVAVPAARGVIDVVLRRAEAGLVVACECHSELRRLELVIRRLGEKAEGLAGQMEPGTTVSRLLLLRSTSATRSIARAYEATLAAAFPGKSAEALDALKGSAAWPDSAIVWCRLGSGRAEILDTPPRAIRLGR
jgi:transcriptional regulator with XRE-family HTH domain